jgi:hypothetical protein
MRARPLALTLLAVAVLLAAAYGVVEWLDATAPEVSRSPSPRNELAPPPVARSQDLPTEPPAASTDPQIPERAETSAPPSDSKPATIHMRGSVTLFEHLDVDSPLPPPDGTFDLAVLTSSATLRQRVTVQSGDFEFEVPPSSELEIRTFRFGDRVAWIRGETRRPIPDDARLELVATCLASRRLDVVDEADGRPLEDVVVLVATTPDEHPGVFRAHDVLVDRKSSPVELAPFFSRLATRERVAARSSLWVGAKDHAFRRIELDFDRGSDSLRVALERCGSLTVHLHGDADFAKRALWLRLVSKRERTLYLASHVFFSSAVRIDGVRPGTFEVDVVRGDRASARSYGGAVAEIEAGRDTEVTIDVAPPPEFAANEVPITGTIELPAAWGMLHEMFFERIDASIIDEKQIQLSDLPLERAEPRTLRFQTSTRQLGLWSVDIWADNEVRFGGEFVVGPEGATDLFFAIGEPAGLRINYKDASTGARLPASSKPDVHARWETTDVTDLAWGDDQSFGSSYLFIRVPIGPITLRSKCYGYAPLTEHLHIQPGTNEHVALLPLPVGVEAVFTIDGKRASFDESRCPIALRFLEGSDANVEWVEHSSCCWEGYVDRPGSYELTVLPLEGYVPVKPFEVDLQFGKLKRVDIPLSKRP